MIYMGEGAGGAFRVKNHVMSLGSPGILAKARRLQLADASFRDKTRSSSKKKTETLTRHSPTQRI